MTAAATASGAGGDEAAELPHRLQKIRQEIDEAARAAGRSPDEVRLLLATKTVPPERILAAIDAGFPLIGENRVQEVVGKAEALAAAPHQTHFIGHLQPNKVNQLLPHVRCIQTVDSAALAVRLQRRLEVLDGTVEVYLQVNVSGETSKSGVPPEQVRDLLMAVAALDRLTIRGYMTIGLNSPDRRSVRAGYRTLTHLRDRLLAECLPGGTKAVELSMGMSGDFADAIAEGATVVRLGSAVFGSRMPNSPVRGAGPVA